MIQNKRQMFVVIGAFILVLLLGTTTYAFFNYTKTGSANTIKTGRIAFSSTQDGNINLTNVFPIDVTNGIPNDNTKVGAVTVNIVGDTVYSGGIEYLVTATEVTNTVNGKKVPISIDVTTTSGLGTLDDAYFTNRNNNPETSIYKVVAFDAIDENDQLVVGYIKPGQTGVNGDIIIKAYLDANKIAISDTYDGNETDNMGTTTNWVDDRIVLTTTEWNSLQTNGVSFRIKVESNEGVWVVPYATETIRAISTLEETPYGLIYAGANPDNYVWFNNEQWRILGVYTDTVNGDMLKIIKATPSTTSQMWGNISNNNEWSRSIIQTEYLYDTYYSSLSPIAQRMIEEKAHWDVGAVESSVVAYDSYIHSTSSNSRFDSISYLTPWIGKIGLVTEYEYIYSAENEGTCRTLNPFSFDGYGGNTDCKSKDWLYGTLTNGGSNAAWTISPDYDSRSRAIYISSGGYASSNSTSNYYAVSPVVYLKSNVKITGGNGGVGETNSYKLELNN